MADGGWGRDDQELPGWIEPRDPGYEGSGHQDPRYPEPHEAQSPDEFGYEEAEARHEPTDPGSGAARGRPPRSAGPGWSDSGGRPMLPALPTLAIVGVLLLVAFLLGRATGGGTDVATGSGSTVTSHAKTTTTVEVTTHTVQSNESLSGIATQYGVSTEELASYNGISDVNLVFVGQVLKIPPAGTSVTSRPTTTTTKKQ